MIRSSIFYLLLGLSCLFAIIACDTRQSIDREAVKKEMKSREIKRVRESDVLLEGERVGKLISSSNDSLAKQLVDKYQIAYDTLLWGSTPKDSTISSILGVYQYASDENLDMPQGIQTTDQQELYYCIPLQQNDSILGVVIMRIPRKDLILHYEAD
ncbi:MAG: hypothetical protein AAFO69_01105 [Bacteroidota bacterium]